MSFDTEKRRLTSGTIADALGRGIDPGLAPFIKSINQNPDIMTQQSCSGMPYQGHGGHPYLMLKFRDARARDHYVPRLRAIGYDVQELDRGIWNVDIPNTITVDQKRAVSEPRKRAEELKPYYSPENIKKVIQREYDDVMKGRFATPLECRQFWSRVTRILAEQK